MEEKRYYKQDIVVVPCGLDEVEPQVIMSSTKLRESVEILGIPVLSKVVATIETVFTGVAAEGSTEDKPLVYETRVLGGKYDGKVIFSSCTRDAAKQHISTCKFVKAAEDV